MYMVARLNGHSMDTKTLLMLLMHIGRIIAGMFYFIG